MPSKLLLLGIDAASPELIRQWAEEGKLPAIRDLMRRGASGSVESLKGFFVGSTWPSLYTGLSPAGHGFYRVHQLRSGSYELFRPLDSPDGIGGIPFWRLVSEAGQRVAVMDVPLTRVEKGINGLHVVEWGGHDSVVGFQTSPPELGGKILSRVGAHPHPTICDAPREGAVEFDEYVSELEDAIRLKTEITLDLLGREEWDLFLQVFTESHCVGHQCWHIHDPAHPAHDPEVREAVGDPLERVYRALDGAVAAITEEAGDDARILLFSAHGMSHYRGAKMLLPEILGRLGVTVRRNRRPRTAKGWMKAGARKVWQRLPGGVRDSLRPLKESVSGGGGDGDGPIRIPADVDRSRCFTVPQSCPVSGIRLNLAGREPRGVLDPGPEADAFCETLMADLREIVDEGTGRPLVADVYRTDSLYAGPRLDALPDILVEWADEEPTGTLLHGGGRGATLRASSPRIGTVEKTNSYVRTGDHLSTGMFVFAGPGVVPGARSRPISVMDIHPTVCRLLGLPDPEVDGRIAEQILPRGA